MAKINTPNAQHTERPEWLSDMLKFKRESEKEKNIQIMRIAIDAREHAIFNHVCVVVVAYRVIAKEYVVWYGDRWNNDAHPQNAFCCGNYCQHVKDAFGVFDDRVRTLVNNGHDIAIVDIREMD